MSKPSGKFFLLVQTFKDIRTESGDTETYGLLCTYKFVACLNVLHDVLHTVAKLQSSLQTKDLDLSMGGAGEASPQQLNFSPKSTQLPPPPPQDIPIKIYVYCKFAKKIMSITRMFWRFVLNNQSGVFLFFPVIDKLPLNFQWSVFLGLQYILLMLGPKCHIHLA